MLIVCLALATTLAASLVAFNRASESLHKQEKRRLTATLDGRMNELASYLANIRADLRVQAANPLVAEALQSFGQSWNTLGQRPTEQLQKLYIAGNPHPVGQKFMLDDAGDGSAYSQAHRLDHPCLRQLQQAQGYYDVFLFNKDGDLIYSVFKEADYVTNLIAGPSAQTDLGKAFRGARDNPSRNSEAFFDFSRYAPSNDAPASFISTPILDQAGRSLGALAYQMPIDRIDAVMKNTLGLGQTGEFIVVGMDGLMRNTPRFAEGETIR